MIDIDVAGIMAQIRVFSIIGDSNVKRNVTQTNSRACPQLKGCQVLTCHKVQLLDEAVGQLRPESNVCLLACITNFLISSEEDSMVSKRVAHLRRALLSSAGQLLGSSGNVFSHHTPDVSPEAVVVS